MNPSDPTTTYGPADERITHTPIVFGKILGRNYSGAYNPDGISPLDFLTLLRNPSQIPDAIKSGVLDVDPNKPYVSNTIHHEAIHQVLMKQLAGQVGLPAVRSAITSLPDFPEMSNAVSVFYGKGQGNMADEVPAMILSRDEGLIQNKGNDWIDSKIQEIHGAINKLNPAMAAQVMRLSPPPNPQLQQQLQQPWLSQPQPNQ